MEASPSVADEVTQERRYTDMLISAIIPTFQDAHRTVALVHALRTQTATNGSKLEIIVVDDGSGNGIPEQLRSELADLGNFISLPRNIGRAGALAKGVAEARGDLLLLIDCDCLPAHQDLICQHLKAFAPDVIATIGSIEGDGRGFWHRYQLDSSQRRLRQFGLGISYSGTTANMMVRRTEFNEAGGFDDAYRGYGFEDRDLLLRLARIGKIAWADDATVRHTDRLSLTNVCRKLNDAGRTTSAIFMSDYPQAYRTLGYASIDARTRPTLKPLAWLSGLLLRPMVAVLDPFLERLPYPIAKAIVKAVGAAAYLHGTYLADRVST